MRCGNIPTGSPEQPKWMIHEVMIEFLLVLLLASEPKER